MASDEHDARHVDPFGVRPCRHLAVVVHITDARSMGDDLLECETCGYVARLADLYAAMMPYSPRP